MLSILIFTIGHLAFANGEEVVVIKLRMPVDNSDARFDPYYERDEGACFGITRCHRTNIMRPARIHENLLGKRAAFVQGGMDSETEVSQQRLILLTPPLTEMDIEIIGSGESQVGVIKWDKTRLRPLKFGYAPVLVANDNSGLPLFQEFVADSRRPTPVAAFGSLFRTRIKPLDPELSSQLIESWETATREDLGQFADHYWQTMNPPPRTLDQDREASFSRYFSRAMSCEQELLKTD